jgi:hypothetical protein
VPHFNRRLRSITRRLPPQLLYWLCLPVVPFSYLFNVPVVRALLYGLRAYFQWISWGTWRQRWLDTFDWYSCWYQSAHTYPEVHRWFTDMGLERIALGDVAVSVSGTRRLRRTADRRGSAAHSLRKRGRFINLCVNLFRRRRIDAVA